MDAGPEAERGPAWGGCRPGGRLDMSHGFVRHIRRNQIARYRPGPPGPDPAPQDRTPPPELPGT
uniref:CB068 protein n=1 Tax=Chrysemys picta bellii TaxID=8478 RepID=A0A8C3IFF0_CHRPI